MNIEELKDWQDGARRVLGRKADGMRENLELVTYIIRSFDANDELLSKIDKLEEQVERLQRENDDLSDQLDKAQAEIDELHRQQQMDEVNHRQELLEVKEQSLEADAKTKATEIHNHFGSGSTAQVFNDKVTGKFITKKEKKEKKNKKEKKGEKQWKKIARKMW